MIKTVVEETREVCTLCGGRGQETNTSLTSGVSTCRQCQGTGQVLTKSVTTREFITDEDVDQLTVKIAERLVARMRKDATP